MKRIFLAALLVTSGCLMGGHGYVAGGDLESTDADRLVGSSRLERSGWIHVHLKGSPDRLGYQHGYLLADEIADFLRVIKPYLEKSSKRDWNFYRQTAEQMLWPRVDSEYQREIDGIVAGLQAKGVQADRWDLVALNANQELPYYYVPWLDKKEGKRRPLTLRAIAARSSPQGATPKTGRSSWGTTPGRIMLSGRDGTSSSTLNRSTGLAS